jgi:ATP-dependent Clp protease ATP-binding subunit ClpA
MDAILNHIMRFNPYKGTPVSVTQILHTYLITNEQHKEEVKKYSISPVDLESALQDFIVEKEMVLADRNITTLSVLPSTSAIIERYKEVVPSNANTFYFDRFVLVLLEMSKPNTNEAIEYRYRLNLLVKSGLDFNLLINHAEKSFTAEAETKEEGEFKYGETIEELCVNLNDLALEGRIEEVIGRDDEVLKTIQVLGKKKKNNPVLVGPAGCGKSAIAEGLALKIIEGDVPDVIKNGVIFSLEVGNMVAGTQFRGEFEERMMDLMKEFAALEEKGEITPILFIDEIHSIVGSGNSNGLDFSNIIKPALAKGKLRCIGATTGGEWQKFITMDKALKRRFTVVEVEEPTRDKTVEILKRARKHYEKKHLLTYTDEACERAVDLAIEFVTDSALPDKALDLMDFAGSIFRIKEAKEVGEKQIEFALNRTKGIALDAITKVKKQEKPEPLAPKIKKNLFAQDHAVDQVCDVLEYSLAGLQDDNKPLGSFLLVGPTGVGKTELAKLLSKELKAHLERIDMSEFMEAHSVSKLIGSPPGYVGFEMGGSLTKSIEKNPRCVLLLDEMEKAHPKIQEIFLQAMDNARITDAQGNPISFKNVVILMTSNVGARDAAVKKVGFGASEATKPISDKSIGGFFSPEFMGRLNGVVKFNGLPREMMSKIVYKKVQVFNDTKMIGRGEVIINDEVAEWIVNKDYKPELGARPIEDAVKRHIYTEIKNSILYGELSKGFKKVFVEVKEDKLEFRYE